MLKATGKPRPLSASLSASFVSICTWFPCFSFFCFLEETATITTVPPAALFARRKNSRPFKEYYAEWIGTLKNTLLPPLRSSMSSAPSSSNFLSFHVEMIHHHFQTYYEALDLAASDDVSQLLYPDWRNSLEKPFLWLGDLHPYLFTNLLRSFFDYDDDNDDDDGNDVEIGENRKLFDKPWQIVMAWKSPSKKLMSQIEQIECGLRLMVPALVDRKRNAQAKFADRVGSEWGKCEGNKEAAKAAIVQAVGELMEVMVGVFVDANRLRRSVLAEILSNTTVYQSALFLEGLAQFLVGFRNRELLAEFERCKIPIN